MIVKGNYVMLRHIPRWVEGMHEDARRAFGLAVGSVFEVADVDEYGHLELRLGQDIDKAMGTIGNTIWVDPEEVDIIET